MSDKADPLFAGRMRLAQYVSYFWILFACAIFALLVGKHWAWGPFVVAFACIWLGAAINALVVRQAMAWFHPTEEQLRRAASKRRQRNKVLVPGYAAFAVGFGLVAGSIPSYWVAAGLAAMIVLMTVIVPLVMLPTVKRRIEAQKTAPPNDQ